MFSPLALLGVGLGWLVVIPMASTSAQRRRAGRTEAYFLVRAKARNLTDIH